MATELEKYLSALNKGDKVSVILAGIIVDGTFEELVDGHLVLTQATSPSGKKKQYSLRIPTENIFGWGTKEKKGRGKKEKKAEES